MASFKFHLRKSKTKDSSKGKLFIRIIHLRKTAYLSTNYTLYLHEWEVSSSSLIVPPASHIRYEYLKTVEQGMQNILYMLQTVVCELELKGEYTLKNVIEDFKRKSEDISLKKYCERVKSKLEYAGRHRTARAYGSAVTSLYKFIGGKEVLLQDINIQLIMDYENYLISEGLKLNTISFYMRNLRALYRRAIKEKLIREKEEMPFSRVFTGVAESGKRTLSCAELNRLAGVEQLLDTAINKCPSHPDSRREAARKKGYMKLKKALLYFLFCYHARGMSFVDLCYLKKTDIREDILLYRRKKTGGLLTVRVTPPMKKIIRFFSTDTAASPYLFPIISEPGKEERKQYERGLRLQNECLRVLTQLAGVKSKVTTHVSRHTWATLAKRSKVSIPLISEALGHKDIKTTDRYLASFENSVMDKLSIRMSGLIGNKQRSA